MAFRRHSMPHGRLLGTLSPQATSCVTPSLVHRDVGLKGCGAAREILGAQLPGSGRFRCDASVTHRKGTLRRAQTDMERQGWRKSRHGLARHTRPRNEGDAELGTPGGEHHLEPGLSADSLQGRVGAGLGVLSPGGSGPVFDRGSPVWVCEAPWLRGILIQRLWLAP